MAESFGAQATGHHNAHTPETQMLSETVATGLWYFCDNMYAPDHDFYVTGPGIYFDQY